MDETKNTKGKGKIKKTKDSVIIPVSKKPNEDKIKKLEEGVFHDEHGRLLYEPDEEYKSCCFSCDKPLCLYIGKYTISLLVLVFCFLMLQDKSNSAEFYTGTIAGLLGHYLNTPIEQKGQKKDKKN